MHPRVLPRLLEIVPTASVWLIITAPVWAAIVAPAALGFFLVLFSIYWLWKSANFAAGVAIGFWRLQQRAEARLGRRGRAAARLRPGAPPGALPNLWRERRDPCRHLALRVAPGLPARSRVGGAGLRGARCAGAGARRTAGGALRLVVRALAGHVPPGIAGRGQRQVFEPHLGGAARSGRADRYGQGRSGAPDRDRVRRGLEAPSRLSVGAQPRRAHASQWPAAHLPASHPVLCQPLALDCAAARHEQHLLAVGAGAHGAQPSPGDAVDLLVELVGGARGGLLGRRRDPRRLAHVLQGAVPLWTAGEGATDLPARSTPTRPKAQRCSARSSTSTSRSCAGRGACPRSRTSPWVRRAPTTCPGTCA